MLDSYSFMMNNKRDIDSVLYYQDSFNVNLNSSGEGDDYLDENEDQGINEVSIGELFKQEIKY